MSARIIKANLTRDVSSTELFHFVDLQRHGERLLESARSEAVRILASASQDAESLFEQTLRAAREHGRLEGLRDAEQFILEKSSELAESRVTAQLETALPALRAAAESLQAERDQWLVRWEQTAVRLGIAIAEKLLQRQLLARPEFATAMISDALRLAAGQPKLAVYLHPDDLSAWGDRASQIVQSLTACADTTLVPDPSAMRGGCRIETRHGEIDARVETMLYRISEELLEE
jgi:flagellar assembly protein FliH